MNGIEAPIMTFPTKVSLRLFLFTVGFVKDVKLPLFFGVASLPASSLCLAEQTSWEWVEQCITIYADDFLVHQSCTTMDSLFSVCFTIVEFSLILLAEYNLQINLQKCFSMVSLQGNAHRKTRKDTGQIPQAH